jgi:hypothetical protein
MRGRENPEKGTLLQLYVALSGVLSGFLSATAQARQVVPVPMPRTMRFGPEFYRFATPRH